jgi:hypothetical protein
VSLPDCNVAGSLVIPRRTSCGLLDSRRGHPFDRFRVRCRCGRGGGWFFHDRGARSQEHGSNRQQWSKNNKFFHNWSCSFKDESVHVPRPDVFRTKIFSLRDGEFPSLALEGQSRSGSIVYIRPQLFQFGPPSFPLEDSPFQSRWAWRALSAGLFTATALNRPLLLPAPLNYIKHSLPCERAIASL